MKKLKMPKLQLTVEQIDQVMLREMEIMLLQHTEWLDDEEVDAFKVVWAYYSSPDYVSKMRAKHKELRNDSK